MPLLSSSSNTAVCSFEAWTQEGFHFSAVLLYSNVFSVWGIGKGKLCPMRCSGVRRGVYDFDYLFCEARTVGNYTSINVRIKTLKPSNIMFVSLWNHAGLCYESTFPRCLSHIHPNTLAPHYQEDTPLWDTHPLTTSLPVQVLSVHRCRKVQRHCQGSMRWRSHEGHSSLGGWAMSRGAWRAEAGLSHRSSVLQSTSQCCSAQIQTLISYTTVPIFFIFPIFSI